VITPAIGGVAEEWAERGEESVRRRKLLLGGDHGFHAVAADAFGLFDVGR
jgi:hypothetical protein